MNIDKQLDGVFEVKLDDKQNGYLRAKLSPKSKSALKKLIVEARIEEVQDIKEQHYLCAIEGKHTPDCFRKSLDYRLREGKE